MKIFLFYFLFHFVLHDITFHIRAFHHHNEIKNAINIEFKVSVHRRTALINIYRSRFNLKLICLMFLCDKGKVHTFKNYQFISESKCW
jgi:Rps23 Pro-64 3,4-dihydroxylase Tpa1-like proline 4-hydroxylase